MKKILLSLTALLAASTMHNAWADAVNTTGIEKQDVNVIAIVMFLAFVGITLYVTKWAAARTKTAADFYTAGGGITGFQNGLAIAGDYMSAASFLGISATVMGFGYDGLTYSIGFLVGWPIIVFLIADRLRNLGRFTFSDVAGYRFATAPVRGLAATGTMVVVILYLIAQMVGAGALIQILFGLDYFVAVIIVGVLMIIYVLFGGMTATTWVQIIKACLLLAGASFMALMVMVEFGFDINAMFSQAIAVKTEIALKDPALLQKAAEVAAQTSQPVQQVVNDMAAKQGGSIMGPGNFLKDPISAISFGMALMFGTAGLPHILMRFFTVPDAKQARASVLWATTWIGYFYILTFIIGFGAIIFVANNPEFLNEKGQVIQAGSMPAIFLAKVVGGNIFLGFISAVAFATILAVVAGLTLSGASAISHDLYSTVIRKGQSDSASELKISRITTLALGVISVVLGIVFKDINVAFMVSLAFAVAASTNFPVLLLSLFWRGMTTRGAVIGGFLGLISSVVMVVLSDAVWVKVLGHPDGSALFPYTSPAIFSIPLGFIGIWFFSITDKSPRAAVDKAGFDAQLVRAETGVGASKASSH